MLSGCTSPNVPRRALPATAAERSATFSRRCAERESRQRCGRVPAQTWDRPLGRQCRIRRRCGYTPKRLPAAQAYARAFARASKCARVCACVGLGFILFVHRTRFAAVSGRVRIRKKAVHACPGELLCVRVWALGRPRVHMCMRACSRGDGRGVGRSRTARFARVPRYSPACVLRHVRS